MTTTIAQQVRLDGATRLLRSLAAQYYEGCKAYHTIQPATVERGQWHARLKTITQIGNQLADALVQPRPRWDVLYHLAHRYRHSTRDPFTTTTVVSS